MAERDKRRYFSPTRREQAGATRLAIVRAARQLFAQRGYAATTIEAIAAATGVAVQTVYATLGSKRAILVALIDLVKEETDVAGNYARLMTEEDPREQLRLVAHLTRRYSEGAW